MQVFATALLVTDRLMNSLIQMLFLKAFRIHLESRLLSQHILKILRKYFPKHY